MFIFLDQENQRKKPTDTKKLVKIFTHNFLTKKIAYNMCKGFLKDELNSGVTTIRAVGGIQNFDSLLRDDVESGKVYGPRILAANMAISVPGGHMAGSLAYEATSKEEAAAYVDKIALDKPDLIKLMITGGVLDATKEGEPGVLRMDPTLVKAACDRAHALGFKVAAHVESTEGVEVALENGVDSIEHGAKPNDKIIKLFKEKKACQVTTISPALPYALFDLDISHATKVQKINGKIVFDGIIDCAKACLENNIPVGLGTDTGCPYITHYDMWRELVYFHHYCNVSNGFALYSATLGNAKIIGKDDVFGSIEKGKIADMIITKENPLDNLEALRNVNMVITKGKIINNPEIKKMPEVEKELDKYL